VKQLVWLWLWVLCAAPAAAQTDTLPPAFQPNLCLTPQQFAQRALVPKDTIWVVDFWASWCRPCLEGMQEMKRLYPTVRGQRVEFIGINIDETPQSFLYFLHTFQVPWPQVHFPPATSDAWVQRHFRFQGIPALFIIGHDGSVRPVRMWWQLERELVKAVKRRGGG